MLKTTPLRSLSLMAALSLFAPFGATAAVSTYVTNFSGLTLNAIYDGTNATVGAFEPSGSSNDLSWTWSEINTINIRNPYLSTSGPALQMGSGDGMTYSFTLASQPFITGYDVQFGYILQGDEGTSTASVTSSMGPLLSESFGVPRATAGLTAPAAPVFKLESFSNVAAGTYTITLQRTQGQFTLNAFAIQTESVAAPVPEPHAFALAALGLVVVGAAALRRRNAAA